MILVWTPDRAPELALQWEGFGLQRGKHFLPVRWLDTGCVPVGDGTSQTSSCRSLALSYLSEG